MGGRIHMKRIIVAITGASGTILGYKLLEALHNKKDVETYLVISQGAKTTLLDESNISVEQVEALADYVFDEYEMNAHISSGSYKTDGMVILPCSMKTLSALANAYDDNLIVRAADVCLKENRRVILSPREMTFNSIHLRNMKLCADAGYVIMPPVFTFYNKPQTMADQINHFIGKILMQLDIEYSKFTPWRSQ